ncbi:MAG: flavodoxin family protein [Patescibacteria group bacterium]|nr:flavodoxin family protein [Patescibacteria group bacterium]
MLKKLKILGLCLSQRGKESNTYYLLKNAFDQIKNKEIEKEIIIASELKLRPCEHHYSVNPKMCVHPCLITQTDKTDEMKKIYDAILYSDIIIFATPIYWGSHSSLAQKVIERLNSLENSCSVFKKVLVKNKIGGIMVLGHEDGYQHVVGNLMNFMTKLGVIFPPQAYAAWVGESDENTSRDRTRLEQDQDIKAEFNGLVENLVNFSKKVLFCEDCGKKFDYEFVSKRKVE